MILTEEQIHALAPDAKSAKAAKGIVEDNSLSELRASPDGRWLAAEAQGSMQEPYSVLAELGDVARFRCQCGSFKYPCKHALAVLLLRLRQPERFRADPSLGGASLTTEPIPLALPATGPTAPPTNEGEALMQAIFDEPEEIAHRLVYADWLEDQGDAERAEFIRVQCEVERGGTGPRLQQLLKRESELLKKHRQAWLADVPKHLRGKVEMRGGFVSHVVMPAKSLIKYGAALFERYPIASMQLAFDAEEKTAGLLAVEPFLARIRALKMRCNGRVIGILLDSVFLKNVRHLNLWTQQGGSRICQSLAAWPALKNLNTLILEYGEITDHAVETLCAANPLSLRTLILGDNGITSAGAETLARCTALAQLRNLNLGNNKIGPKGVQALAATPHLSSLRELNLSGNPITDQGAKALAASPALASLTKLSLIDVDLGDPARAVLRERFGDRVVFEF